MHKHDWRPRAVTSIGTLYQCAGCKATASDVEPQVKPPKTVLVFARGTRRQEVAA